jgi:hypothetical protein
MRTELERSFDTEAEREAYFQGLDTGIGWSELRSWETTDPKTPKAVVVPLTTKQSEYVEDLARENGVSFENYAGNLLDKGLSYEKDSLSSESLKLSLDDVRGVIENMDEEDPEDYSDEDLLQIARSALKAALPVVYDKIEDVIAFS